MEKTIKIDVISGFLGAGKTTLIKKLLSGAYQKEHVVLIENEFGEIGVDGAFLKDSGIEIKEINAGCICCSLVGNFSESMIELVNKFNPDRIIIEPSGVGKLSDIVVAINNVDLPLQINVLATVVDGKKCKMYLKNFGEFFTNQVAAASTIILSKTDKITAEQIDEDVQLIRSINPTAPITTTPLTEFTSEEVLALCEKKVGLADELKELIDKEHEEVMKEEEEHHHHHHHHDDDDDDDEECCCHHHHDDDDDDEECCCHEHHEAHGEDVHEEHAHEHAHEHHHHHGHDADEVFDNIGLETAASITKSQLEKFLNYLANDESIGIVLRSKGVLKGEGTWYYFDFVNGDWEIREGQPDYTGRLCVIGSHLKEHEIEEYFLKGCRE